MKKIILFLLLAAFLALALPAVKLDLGLLYSARTVSDDAIQDVYGSGGVYFPYAAINVWKCLGFGLGYEGGYDRDGKIGLYQEDTSLKVGGATSASCRPTPSWGSAPIPTSRSSAARARSMTARWRRAWPPGCATMPARGCSWPPRSSTCR